MKKSEATSGIKIEKGIPISQRRGSGITEVMRKMDIGDSFVVDCSARNGIGALAKNAGIKTTTRTIDGKVRVWRIK